MTNLDLLHDLEFFDFKCYRFNNHCKRKMDRVAKGCYGELTKSVPSNEKLKKVLVDLHFNLFSSDTEFDFVHFEANHHDKVVLATQKQCSNELKYIYHHVSQYVNFDYSINYDKQCEWTWESTRPRFETNSVLHLEFCNHYMYEIFFVLHAFRRYINLKSNFGYYQSKKLAKQKWHNLSFTNISLLLDYGNYNLPFDQKMLGYFTMRTCSKFLSKNEFKNNFYACEKLKPFMSKYVVALSTLCTTNLDSYCNDNLLAKLPLLFKPSFPAVINSQSVISGRIYGKQRLYKCKLERLYKSCLQQFKENSKCRNVIINQSNN